MKKTNKLISILLVLAMLLSMAPLSLTASAAENLTDTTTSVTLKDTDADGAYEIGTAEELEAFTNLVNSGNNAIAAELIADINYNPGYGFTFDYDIGLVVISKDDNAVAYIGTNVLGDESGSNTFFDTTASVAGTVYSDAVGTTGVLPEDLKIWKPIGKYNDNYDGNGVEYPYIGTFDGAGYAVSGLVSLYGINDLVDFAGLFGYVSYSDNSTTDDTTDDIYGTIKNVEVTNSFFYANRYTGGICGYLNDGAIIENCCNSGIVIATRAVGGITGTMSDNAKIVGSHNSGLVCAAKYEDVAGIVGRTYENSLVENCYNSGKVISASTSRNAFVGGIVGYNYIGKIRNCYNTGSVSAIKMRVGGICGYHYDGTLENSHSVGTLSGEDYVGGIVGYYNTGTLSNCYYLSGTADGGVDGADKVGSAEAKTAEEFADGTVYELLQNANTEQVWGQIIDTDNYPVFYNGSNKPVPPHTHSFIYTVSVSGDRIVATCTADGCPLENGDGGYITISAPADLYVDGNAKEAVVDNQLADTSVTYEVTYSTADGSAPTAAGTYTASVTLGDATASVEFTLLNYAASVTDKDGKLIGNYTTFDEAITAAMENAYSTLTLLDDTEGSYAYIYQSPLTLDLNGYTLDMGDDNFCIGSSSDGVEPHLTLTDTSEAGTGKITGSASYYGIFYLVNSISPGKLIVQGGTIEYTGRHGAVALCDNGALEMSGGSIKSTACTIYINNWDADFVGSVDISGGNFFDGLKIQVYSTEYTSTVQYLADLLAEGYAFYNENGNKITVADDATEITGYVQVKKIPPAASVTDADGNLIGNYKTLAEAVTAASASEGSTLTLLDNITLTTELMLSSGKFTLDLNGKTLLNETGVTLWLEADADITVKDSGEGGTVKSGAANSSAILNEGTLTVESGNIISENNAVNSHGTLTVNGGSFEGKKCSVYIFEGTSEINGGEFNGNVWGFAPYTINNGDFTAEYIGINSEGGVLTVNGGTFDIDKIQIFKGTVSLKGGEFTNGFTVYDAKMDSDAEQFAATILADGYYYKDADGKVITVADDAKAISGYAKVAKGADLANDAVITVDETELVYNGESQRPAVTVTVGGKTLTENVDYSVNCREEQNGVPVNWAHYYNAGVHPLRIEGLGDYTGRVEKEFVIKPATVDIVWSADEFYYTGNPYAVTAKYVDINGDEIDVASITNGENTEVGTYIATAAIEDDNYIASGTTINHSYEIKWYDGAPDASVTGTQGENGYYTSIVTVTTPDGYTVSTAVDGDYSDNITFDDEENAVYYVKETETGYIAKVELGEIKTDLADPTAEITLGENKWNTFLNAVTFGKFFKETQTVTVTAADTESGIAKVEYVVAAEEITDFENAQWTEYTEALKLVPNSKNIIYARATDVAGRKIIVNSDGVVVYTDSKAITTEAAYILTSMEDVEVAIELNDNTVEAVSVGGNVITDYTVTENGIVISDEYLENLAAGEYDVTITVNPMGEAFDEGDAPETVNVKLVVEKLEGKVEITKDISKTYDSAAVSAPKYNVTGTGKVTVEYKAKDADDSAYTTAAPANAGEYTVRVSVAETDKSTYAEATADFTIAKREVTITGVTVEASKDYDGNTDAVITGYGKLENNISKDDVTIDATNAKAAYADKNVGEDIAVTFSGFAIKGEDIENYVLAAQPASVTADITKKEVTAIATVPDKVYDGTSAADISKITITFDGVVDGETVEYKVVGAQFSNAEVGKNKNVLVMFVTSGEVASNYDFHGDYLYASEAYYYAEATASITAKDIANAEIVLGDALTYTGAEQAQTIASVTVDGLTVTYDIGGDKATNVGVYELTIAGNGNFAGTKTALYEIAPDTTPIDDLTVENVKSSDKEDIEAVKAQIENAVTDLADDETKAEYKAISDKCDELLNKIAETAKEIERIENAVAGYDEETVKSSDEETINQLKEDIQTLIDSGNVTEEEIKALEENKADADTLTDKIDETQAEIERINEAVDSYTEDTVKSTDEEAINQLKEDIKALVDSGNVTEEEIAALEDTKADADALTDKITETEEKLEKIAEIEKGYDPETVTSDDKAAIEAAIAEIEAVNPDNLTDEQKAEYDEIKAGFEALLDEIAAAEKNVTDIGVELEMFDENRVTIFWEDDIEALKAKIDELLADENMGEAEKTKLNEYKAQCDNLIEIIHSPVKYLSLRFFYFIWDCLCWKWNGIVKLFNLIF